MYIYHNDPNGKYWVIKACTNSAEPDQLLSKEASDHLATFSDLSWQSASPFYYLYKQCRYRQNGLQ